MLLDKSLNTGESMSNQEYEETVLYPDIEPYDVGKLSVSDLHTIVYEEVGSPRGRPALFLHGGPGVGISSSYRRFFDPEYYRLVQDDNKRAEWAVVQPKDVPIETGLAKASFSRPNNDTSLRHS